MTPKTTHPRRAVVLAATLLALLCAAATAPQALAADTLQLTLASSAPEQGVPLTIEFSGTSESIDSEGDGPDLVAVVRPAGGIGCQANSGDDHSAAGGATTQLEFGTYEYNDVEVGPGAYHESSTFDPPSTGAYMICAWLESGSTTEAGPISTTFTAAAPQVSELSVALPVAPIPNVAFQIDYTTHTDQKLALASVIRPAGALPCAANSSLDAQQNESEDTLFDSDYFDEATSVFGGPTTTTATATEPGGAYLICTWIEGPSSDEVDASAAMSIYVGTPPPPPPPPAPAARVVHAISPRLALSVVSVSKRHGTLVQGHGSPSLAGRMTVGVACGSSTAHGRARVVHGRFTLRLATPRGCRAGRRARVWATWPGSRGYLEQSVAGAFEVTR